MDINSSSVINIIIGDSRMVCLCATLTGDWTRCQYSSGGGYRYDNVYFVAQGSMSYSWFNNTAIAAVNNILSIQIGKLILLQIWGLTCFCMMLITISLNIMNY